MCTVRERCPAGFLDMKCHNLFKAGLDFVGEKWVCRCFFLKGKIAEMSILGWLEVFWAVKLCLKHFCENAKIRFWHFLCRYW